MAKEQLLVLFLLCFVTSWTHSHPNLLWPITNPQVIIIRCAHEYLFQYGTICVKFPANWNGSIPSATPAPAPPSPQPPSPQPPPGEEPPATEEPASTPPPTDESTTARRLQQPVVRLPRQTRGINIGPSFSLSLPPLKPPLSFYLASPGPPPPPTVVVFPG